MVRTGVKAPGKSEREKKAMPVVSKVMGVIKAATPQPKRLKMTRPRSMRQSVTMPVPVEKLPMKAEYAFGSVERGQDGRVRTVDARQTE